MCSEVLGSLAWPACNVLTCCFKGPCASSTRWFEWLHSSDASRAGLILQLRLNSSSVFGSALLAAVQVGLPAVSRDNSIELPGWVMLKVKQG